MALIAVSVAVTTVPGMMRDSFRRRYDYNVKPPDETFELIFQRPPPRGVSNIRAAGMGGWVADSLVWMSADATPSCIAELLRTLKCTPVEAFEDPSDLTNFFSMFTEPGARATGWCRVPRLLRDGNGQVYRFGGYEGFSGTIVVDPMHGRVYIFAFTT